MISGQLKTNKVFIICLCFLVCASEASKQKISWLQHFMKYTKDNAGVQQVVVLMGDNSETVKSRASKIIRETGQSFPTITISFSESTVKTAQRLIELPTFVNVKTSIFIMIHNPKEDQSFAQLTEPINFLNELSQNRRRPQLLIVLLQDKKGYNYRKLLSQLWSKNFLDATVLELVDVKEKKNNLFRQNQEVATVHYLNPFTQTLKRRKFSSKLRWFPDKLRNLHGYELQVGAIHNPPEIFVTRNESNFVVDMMGPMVNKLQALSDTMHFVARSPYNSTNWGNLSCDKNDILDMRGYLLRNEIQFIVSEFGRYATCHEKEFEWSKGIGAKSICLVVPLMPAEYTFLKTMWKVGHGIFIIGMPLAVWLLARFLRFDTQQWHLTNIVRIVFGTVVPREPRNQAERIVFACTLWAFFFYSSIIYSTFTDTGVHKNVKLKFDKVEDVVKSDLEVLVSKDVFPLVNVTSDGIRRSLMRKARETNLTSDECVHRLVTYKNLSCILLRNEADISLQRQSEKCRQPGAKMLHEYLKRTWPTTILAPGSPYVNRFNSIIQRIKESGVNQQWEKMYFDKDAVLSVHQSCRSERLQSPNTIQQLFSSVVIGYTCSILVFIGELIVAFCLKIARNVNK